MRYVVRLTCGLLAVLLALPAVMLAAGRAPPAPALLAYVTHSYDTGSDIAVVWPDSPDALPRRSSPASGHTPDSPVWSPDQTWIAFTAFEGQNSEVFLMHPNGSDLHNLTRHPARDRAPVWSPDGAWLAFRSDRDGSDDIFVMEADGSGVRNLTDHPAADFSPEWSPDGAWIVFVSVRSGERGLYVVRPDGTDQRRLSSGDAYGPVWSPDGRRIAFLTTLNPVRSGVLPLTPGTESTALMVIDLARAPGRAGIMVAGEPRRLAPGDGDTLAEMSGPVWSPDGTWIAFWGVASGEADVYLIRPDGSDLHLLTHHVAADRVPAWSPDGAWIAFESTRDGNREIYVIRPDGTGVHNVSQNAGVDSAPVWSPPAARRYRFPVLVLLVLVLLVAGYVLELVQMSKRAIMRVSSIQGQQEEESHAYHPRIFIPTR